MFFNTEEARKQVEVFLTADWHPYAERPLNEEEKEYARAYLEYILFTHNVWRGEFNLKARGLLPEEIRQQFVQVKNRLEQAEAALADKTMAGILMFDVSEVLNTPIYRVWKKNVELIMGW
ncbi:MAG: hypothetical protein FJ044_02140 [Candidatus Cloacimonetes bacterium]|nr:hypothetical protein [Candidatus Cloacimonadota bacterium]